MERASIPAVAVFLVIAGCNRTPKVDYPVAPEPPPRISFQEEPVDESSPGGSEYVSVDDKTPKRKSAREIPTVDELGDPQLLPVRGIRRETAPIDDLGSATGVIALVNGEPIFVENVLEEFAVQIEKYEQAVAAHQATPAQLRAFRAKALRHRLPLHIESKLLSAELLKDFTKEQRKILDRGLEEIFQQEVAKKKKQRGITSQGEFEVELAKSGLTIDRLRQANNERNMAQQYIAINAGPQPRFSRSELLDYYYEHQEDYAVTGKVRWQQIIINFSGKRDRARARQLISTIGENLIDGGDFGELAREHSDGSTAESGGDWDWTERGSLADEEVETALFTIPVDTFSDVMESAESFQLVKVVERIEPGYQPFTEVYNEIAKSLKEERYKAIAARLIKKLKRTAVIERKYDLDPPREENSNAPYAMESKVELR